MLTPDTSQQKIAMLIGPKRSGKGTIIRTITGMPGADNVVNPTLSSLATQFGLALLIGKPAAIISDARNSGRTDTAVVIERLLSISGEDAQTIDRKHRDDITTRLPTRFMIVSNELPKIQDTSGALAGRLILFELTNSFYGKGDPNLMAKLIPELPGFLKWSIEGWARLRERGRFSQPSSGQDLLSAMEDLASPMLAFLRENCKVEPGATVPVKDIFGEWRNWSLARGREEKRIDDLIGRDFHAAIPGLKSYRQRDPKDRTKKVNIYVGVRMMSDGEWRKRDDREDDIPF